MIREKITPLICMTTYVPLEGICWGQFKRRFPSHLFHAFGYLKCSFFKCEVPDLKKHCKMNALFFMVENKSCDCLQKRPRYGCSYISCTAAGYSYISCTAAGYRETDITSSKFCEDRDAKHSSFLLRCRRAMAVSCYQLFYLLPELLCI
jgi:hypothetical protein